MSKNIIKKLTKKWKSWRCHDCDAKEGEIHQMGCDMEICPKCGNQLLGCDCGVFEDGKKRHRIPYLLIPNMCRLCGEQWPDMFMVSNQEWEKYVIPPLQNEILCQECYNKLKEIFPDGWKKAPSKNNEPRRI